MNGEKVKEILSGMDLFAGVDSTLLHSFCEKFEIFEYSLGEIIAQSGDQIEHFSIITKGKVRLVEDRNVATSITHYTLQKNDMFGGEGILQAKMYNYSARAAGNVELIRIPIENLALLANGQKQIKQKIADWLSWFNDYRFLRIHPLFSKFKPKDAQDYFTQVQRNVLPEGNNIFVENQVAEKAYLIGEGKLKLVKSGKSQRLMSIASHNEIVGEEVLSDVKTYHVSSITISDIVVYEFDKELLLRMSEKYAHVSEYFKKLRKNRKLQYESILAADDAFENREEERQFEFSHHRGFLGTDYLIAKTQNRSLRGVACLMMLQKHYSIKKPVKKFIEEQLLLAEEDNLFSLSKKIEAQGFLTQLLYITEDQLEGLAFPLVIKYEDNKTVLVLEMNNKSVIMVSPEKGIIEISREDFLKYWDKRVLTVSYVPEFKGIGNQLNQVASRFLPLLKPFKGLILGLLAITIFMQILGLVVPAFSATIIDKVLVLRDRSMLYLILLGMLFVTSFIMIGEALKSYLTAHIMRRLSILLQFRFLKHILQLPQKIFIKWQVGDFTSRFQENDKVLQLVSQNGVKIFIDSFTIMLYLIVLFSADTTLAFYSLIFVFCYAILIFISSPILRRNDIRTFNALKNTESFIIELVGNIRTVKSMATENHFFDMGMKKFVHSKVTAFKGALFAYNISAIGTLLNQASIVLVLGIGAEMVLNNTMTTGELIFFNMTLGLLLAPLNGLVRMWDEIQELRVSFERINDVLDKEIEPVDRLILTEPLKGDITIENLYFRYGNTEKYELENINLEIKAGQKIAFVGRSGSGKTTLANILMKLYEPEQGTIYYDDRDISEIDSASLRQQIGFVEQSPFLFNGTIRENLIKSNPDISFDDMASIAKLAGVEEFVSTMPLGYDTQIGEKGMTLSGGQRQRIVIARALMTSPRLLILDEATSALDTDTERIIQQNLDSVLKNKTSIIIAHRLSTIKNADKIVVLDEGKIVEIGTHDELLEKGGLYYYLTQKSG